MPKKGYKPTEIHKKRLSEKAKLRGNNGWLGRKHRPEIIEKMRRPHSEAHNARIRESILKLWAKRREKNGWIVQKEIIEPVAPQQYMDIFMDGYIRDSEGTLWEEV